MKYVKGRRSYSMTINNDTTHVSALNNENGEIDPEIPYTLYYIIYISIIIISYIIIIII